MIKLGDCAFRQAWVVDFEFTAPPGERVTPICMVAHELGTGQTLRIWRDKLASLESAPFPTDPASLFIAYYAPAEMACFLALGWKLPSSVLDLYVEFRRHTNGRFVPSGNGLLGAMAYYGLPSMDGAEKSSMRDLAIRGAPFTDEERAGLLAYCEEDVTALRKLLPAMQPALDIERALQRGRFMTAAACIEYNGIPIDRPMLDKLRNGWPSIQDALIAEVDRNYNVLEGRSFRMGKFEQYLACNDIPWPRLASGALDLSEETFREMSRAYPVVKPLHQLRVSLSQMRLSELCVGTDDRNRALLSPFRARTGRNQPSTSRFIFGPSAWLRALIKPPPGVGLAYLDWSQQEFGIAAALSRDLAMQAAYLSGDPYLTFAKQAGAVPSDATKETHKEQREKFKACVLATQYGMGAEALAARINQPPIAARELLRQHRDTYRVFWAWSDAVLDYAMLHGHLWTTFGWTIHVGPDANARSLRNFLMQANGAEMLRIACCLAIEAGVKVVAPVHDAILIEAPLEELDAAVARTQRLMEQASQIVLAGFPLRSEAKIVRHPGRFEDGRGTGMWETVTRLLAEETSVQQQPA